MLSPARELDLLGARAWPPLEEVRVGDWRLRFAGGVTKRANSVLALDPERAPGLGARELGRRVALVEREYRARGLAPRFQVTASSSPGLADELRRRGYVESDPTLVLAGSTSAPPGTWADLRVTLRGESSEEWLDAWLRIDGRGGPAEAEIARAILGRIETLRVFAECRAEGDVVAVGLGVVEGDWVGVYCMGTLPAWRRRGCGRAVLVSVLRFAEGRGAARAHLSVTEDNDAALALYRSTGFGPRQRYSYFTA